MGQLRIYINDPHNAIKFWQSFHFADNTCLLNNQIIISKINRNLFKDLKKLSFRRNANKIALNTAKQRLYSLKVYWVMLCYGISYIEKDSIKQNI